MAQKIGYEVNGEVVASLKEVATLLGVPKVSKKDVMEGGDLADQVSLVDIDEVGDNVETDDVEDTGNWEEGYPQGTANTVDPDTVDISADEVLESMPEFSEGEEGLKEFKEFFKDLDTPTAEYLAVGLGLEWKPTDHENIHRMRVSMAMQRYFFPELFKPKETKKKKAKYGDFSTEDLFKMAEESDTEFKKTGNEPIDRMRVIMALKQAGHLEE